MGTETKANGRTIGTKNRNIFREMKEQNTQTETRMYFCKWNPGVLVSPTSPSASTAPERARPTSPLPQPAQCEDSEDPLPFREQGIETMPHS